MGTDCDGSALLRAVTVTSSKTEASSSAEKMVVGRMQKFYQDVVLNEQKFVIDGETKIKDVIKKLEKDLNTKVELTEFKKIILGEGIEVSENDFAAEVAATAGIK